MRKSSSLHNLMVAAARLRLSSLLMAAAALHLLLVVIINLIGRFALLPATFDSNGIGVSFAVDSVPYRNYIIALVNVLKRDGLLAWLRDTAPFHVKFYSLCYALFGDWLGYTTLSAEPLNLAYYLLILTLVFLLGRELFDRRVGLLSAALVALWPSLLLHTTQLLRDPLFIGAFLGLVLVCVLLIRRDCSWGRAALLAFAGGLAANVIWLFRSQMWEVMLAVACLTLCFRVIKQALEKRRALQNLLGCVLLLLMVLGLQQLGQRFNLYSYPATQTVVADESRAQGKVVYGRRLPPGSSLPARISYLRHSFVVSYPRAGSNIDTDVYFNNISDIILYLPRATAIGFFAPFPNMWFVEGPQVGLAGRILSGAETLLMYLLEVLAAICLWRHRRRLSVWLLFITASTGLVALGLVVANVATLYRMRYAFWILLIVLGIEGAFTLASNAFSQRSEN